MFGGLFCHMNENSFRFTKFPYDYKSCYSIKLFKLIKFLFFIFWVPNLLRPKVVTAVKISLYSV